MLSVPIASSDAHQPDEQELAEGDDADAEDLARQQLARADRAQEELDDARRLLLHDPGRDPVAVADELEEQEEDRDGGEALRLVVATRVELDDAQRWRRQHVALRRGVQPRPRERRLRAHERRALPQHGAEVVVEVGAHEHLRRVADERRVGVAVEHPLTRLRLARALDRQLEVQRLGRGGRRRDDLLAGLGRHGDRRRLVAEAQRAREHDDGGEDPDRHQGGDEERPLADARDDLALGDEEDRLMPLTRPRSSAKRTRRPTKSALRPRGTARPAWRRPARRA